MNPRNTYWAVMSQLPMEMASTCMSGPRSAEEHRMEKLFVIEQLARGAGELHLPPFHVDGAIGDSQRHVDGLLDDHHGQAFGFEPFDDREELLHDERRQPE